MAVVRRLAVAVYHTAGRGWDLKRIPSGSPPRIFIQLWDASLLPNSFAFSIFKLDEAIFIENEKK